MVSTLDFESNDPSSSLGGTSLVFFFRLHHFLFLIIHTKVWVKLKHEITFSNHWHKWSKNRNTHILYCCLDMSIIRENFSFAANWSTPFPPPQKKSKQQTNKQTNKQTCAARFFNHAENAIPSATLGWGHSLYNPDKLVHEAVREGEGEGGGGE